MSIRRNFRTGLRNLALVAAFLVSALFVQPLEAHDGEQHDPETAPAAEVQPDPAKTQVKIPDVVLKDRNGKDIRIRSLLEDSGVVAIDFVYTTCTTICPVISTIFAQVQEELGDRLGKDMRLLSISLDPTRDSAGRMAEAAAKVSANPEWAWLTGEKEFVDQVLVGLGAYTPDVTSHPPMVVIGDAKRDHWIRLYGFVSPEKIVKQMERLSKARRIKDAAQTAEE